MTMNNWDGPTKYPCPIQQAWDMVGRAGRRGKELAWVRRSAQELREREKRREPEEVRRKEREQEGRRKDARAGESGEFKGPGCTMQEAKRSQLGTNYCWS